MIVVGNLAGDLPHGTSSNHGDRGRDAGDNPFPGAARKSVPTDIYFLSFGQLADVRLIDKSAHLNGVEGGHLHNQIAGIDV